MSHRLPVILLLMTTSLDLVRTNNDNWDKCGGRLERALDSIRRDSSRKNRLDDDDSKVIYQQKLKSAPLEMIVSQISVKVPQDLRNRGAGPWAKVDRCIYEPSNNSVQTRVMFNDLSVSGLVSLLPRSHNVDIPGESCRMSLRLRRAGVEFYTNPIARGRGQMRIRTESSFLEPRFASIYAYGCRPTRHDKQIKRQDKWPPYYRPEDELTVIEPVTVESAHNEDYESPEPRELAAVSSDEDVVVVNESKPSQSYYSAGPRLGIWRDSSWVTKSQRSIDDSSSRRFRRDSESPPSATKMHEAVNSADLIVALMKQNKSITNSTNTTSSQEDLGFQGQTSQELHVEQLFDSLAHQATRQPRQILLEEDDLLEDQESLGRDWQARENVAREMEDIFLRGASEALTRYIEKQLHPAIKETLMLSMGYTISYG